MFTKLNAYWIPKHCGTNTKWTVRWNSADEPDTRGGEPGLPGRWGLQSMQECVATQTSCLEQHTLESGWVLSVSPPQLFQWLLLPGAPSRSGVSWTRLLSSGAQSRAGLVAPSQETQGANNPTAKEKWTHEYMNSFMKTCSVNWFTEHVFIKTQGLVLFNPLWWVKWQYLQNMFSFEKCLGETMCATYLVGVYTYPVTETRLQQQVWKNGKIHTGWQFLKFT